MNLLKTMILSAAMLLSFSVSGGELSAIEGIASQQTAIDGDTRTPENYNCCWFYIMGHWWCVSCVMGE